MTDIELPWKSTPDRDGDSLRVSGCFDNRGILIEVTGGGAFVQIGEVPKLIAAIREAAGIPDEYETAEKSAAKAEKLTVILKAGSLNARDIGAIINGKAIEGIHFYSTTVILNVAGRTITKERDDVITIVLPKGGTE